MKIIINKKDHAVLKDLVEEEFYDLEATYLMYDERLKSPDLSINDRFFCQNEYRRAFFKAGYLKKLLYKLGD